MCRGLGGDFGDEDTKRVMYVEKWRDFEDVKITDTFLGFMQLEFYCVVSLKFWFFELNF